MIWTLQEGVAIARKIESIIKHNNAHCALGGSVLHTGESNKDCDIFIYAHDTKGYGRFTLLKLLRNNGILAQEEKQEHKDDYQKTIYKATVDNKRLDLFFI